MLLHTNPVDCISCTNPTKAILRPDPTGPTATVGVQGSCRLIRGAVDLESDANNQAICNMTELPEIFNSEGERSSTKFISKQHQVVVSSIS
ncbi:hypothetical protein SCLCIDRAFT_760308 [Scleroderma citrinum Foug A]|uniref:Uncharacterized protein n=1 Tax=Scleroderma citrinum Foug A TaxID=1036808 RepID=A0A0C3E5A7_9AGAM|nr:hypothetical protein SCLCIDRAFT_760308 [Scleroderma citrinum Foug A]